MRTYERYQSSAVEWLDEVPAHWKGIKLKFLFDGWMGGSWGNDPTGDENDLVCVRVADFDFGNRTLKRKDFTVRNFTPSEQASRLLQKGDLILEKSGGGEKTPVGRVVKFDLDEPALCSNFTNRLIPKSSFDSDFLIYLFFALYNNGVTVSHINQTTGIQNLQVGSFLNETVFIPTTLPEQRAIAAYLDRKTAQIDRLLTQKEVLLQKLNLKRQAVINEAVTQGLEPDAPRKPSGVSWLGDIPAHWYVKKLKYLFDASVGGGTPDTTNDDFWNGAFPWVSPKDMKSPIISATQDYVTELAVKSSSTNLIPENSVMVVVRSGILKHTFPVAINAIPVTLNQDMKAFIPNIMISAQYLAQLLKGFQQHILTQCTKIGATVDSIEMEWLYSFPFPVPPRVEQERIVAYLHESNERINEAAAAIHTQIQTLKAYRKSLVSEVVTGKVDVRPASLSAPEADLPLWLQ